MNVDYEIQRICKSEHAGRVYNFVADYLIQNNATAELPNNLVELSIVATKIILSYEERKTKPCQENEL